MTCASRSHELWPEVCYWHQVSHMSWTEIWWLLWVTWHVTGKQNASPGTPNPTIRHLHNQVSTKTLQVLETGLLIIAKHHLNPYWPYQGFSHPLKIPEKDDKTNHSSPVYDTHNLNLRALPVVFFTFWACHINDSSFWTVAALTASKRVVAEVIFLARFTFWFHSLRRANAFTSHAITKMLPAVAY